MKIVVVGGGMAGLTYSIAAARRGNKVVLCERNKRVGRKVAMSGNGKCNIGNLNADGKFYNAPDFVNDIFARVPTANYLEFLRSVGIYTYADEQGRLYPVTDSASSVVDCLRAETERLGVQTLTESQAVATELGNGFVVRLSDGTKIACDKAVVACGSKSQADETALAELVGKQYLTACVPSLTPVRVKNADGTLNGVRNRAKVTLLRDGKPVAAEFGEVQFKDYGLSGVCVFNLSALIARDIVRGQKHDYVLAVDICPDIDEQTLAGIIRQRITEGKQDYLLGLVKNRVAEYVAKKVKNCTPKDIPERAAKTVKNMAFIFEKLLDYSMSQVTAGGVDLKFVDKQTLSLPNGVTVVGEALDVDGVCGGLNLQFAACSALLLFV